MGQADRVESTEEALQGALAQVMDGELREIGAALQALPEGHPRRRILLANFRQAMALLADMPRLLAR